MMRINGQEVVKTEVEYGVRFDDGTIYEADDKEDAEFFARIWGGVLLGRVWAATNWLEVDA
jgi:hypothetical protein